MDNKSPIARFGKKICPTCGKRLPFWYVKCPRCQTDLVESVSQEKGIVYKSLFNKQVRVVSKIQGANDDISLFKEVLLYYSLDGAISWRQVKMRPEQDKYIADIPEIPKGARIVFYIEATDISGKKIVEDNEGKYFHFIRE
ncbi:MAG: hypothetical protein ACTSVI_11470 [Promethearchaeota archaeon]